MGGLRHISQHNKSFGLSCSSCYNKTHTYLFGGIFPENTKKQKMRIACNEHNRECPLVVWYLENVCRSIGRFVTCLSFALPVCTPCLGSVRIKERIIKERLDLSLVQIIRSHNPKCDFKIYPTSAHNHAHSSAARFRSERMRLTDSLHHFYTNFILHSCRVTLNSPYPSAPPLPSTCRVPQHNSLL